MRTRTIGTDREVSHIWAQGDAVYPNKTKNGNLFFEGSTIYSYGYHFPIAKHVTNEKGQKAILFTLSDYSVTTSSHKRVVRGAIPSETKVFFVNDLDKIDLHFYHGQNPDEKILLPILRAYIMRAEQKIEKAIRSRVYGEMLFSEAKNILADAKEFASFYSLQNKVPTFEELKLAQRSAKIKRSEDD